MGGQKEKKKKKQDSQLSQAKKQQKRKKKEQKQKQERERIQRQLQAQADALVDPIYKSGLADAYKYFLQQLYKQGVRFNVFEYAAQKILKYERIQKQKAKKIEQLQIK